MRIKQRYAGRALCLALCALLSAATLQAATVSWVGGDGDWSTVTNWSSAALPGQNDDVVIDRPGLITVTHSSGSHTVKSIFCQESFVLSGGSLVVCKKSDINKKQMFFFLLRARCVV